MPRYNFRNLAAAETDTSARNWKDAEGPDAGLCYWMANEKDRLRVVIMLDGQSGCLEGVEAYTYEEYDELLETLRNPPRRTRRRAKI